MTQVDTSRKQEFTGIFSVILVMEDRNIILESQTIEELYFIEDIYKSNISGKLTFSDKYDILEYGTFTGNEKIIIQYGEKSDRELVFEIWKINAIRQGTVTNPITNPIVELIFVDVTFLPFVLKKYSRSFGTGEKYSDIIKYILSNIVKIEDKFLSIEDSTNTIDNYIMPYWSPLHAIKFLAERAENINGSGFIFYTNTNEGFKCNLTSFEFLNGVENYLEPEPYVFEVESVNEKNKILEWWIDGLDKFSTKFISGGKWKGFNFATKELLDGELTYSNAVAKTTLNGRKSLYPDISDATASINVVGDDSLKKLNNRAYSNWIQRYSIQQALNIYVRGREDRYAGQQIEIQWPSNDKRTQIYNKMYKGKYVIKSITHSFTGNTAMPYRQRIVLIKNSYASADTNNLLQATKMNIHDKKKRIVRS